MTRWYEDITLGEIYPLGEHTFTEAEIIRFATNYDPQYFHLNAEAAKSSPFGGLVASGWHTAAVGHRKMVDSLDVEAERLRALGQQPGITGPSPGINKAEFKAPVRPGDTLTYSMTVDSKRPSGSLPGWGILINLLQAINQRGELVYRAEIVGFSKLRDYRMPLQLQALLALSRLPGLGALVKR
jgi:acyl dehydratase